MLLSDDPPAAEECPAMRQSATGPLRFAEVGSLPLEVDFLGGRLTSDGGLAWLAEADAALGLTAALAAVVPDWRTRRGRHDLATLVAQRVYRIACGYEDQDDADALRTDPLLNLLAARHPAALVGGGRRGAHGAGDPALPADQDRRLGARTARPGP